MIIFDSRYGVVIACYLRIQILELSYYALFVVFGSILIVCVWECSIDDCSSVE